MFRDEYGRAKNILPLILAVLTLLAAGAGVYFFIAGNNAADKTAVIDAADYRDRAFSADFVAEREQTGVNLGARLEVDMGEGLYVTPLGFPIISDSEKWQGGKLKEIYDELLRNTHGEELGYIAKVIVHPGRSELGTKDSVVAGTHLSTTESFSVFFDLPAVIPPSLQYSISSSQSVIELYNMDEYETIHQAARTIAHEYGHHFTIHYFMQSQQAVLDSQYYILRGVGEYDKPIFYTRQSDYLENHQWSIFEIAAEDYVQLLGSPNAKDIVHYMDVYDVLIDSRDEVYYVEADETVVNVFPQENVYLPLADEIKDLRSYFLSFIDKESALSAFEPFDFNIDMARHSKSGYTYYDITWDKPTSDPGALYTLICYDKDGNIYMPVKTLNGNENPIAKVGTVSRISGTTLTTVTNSITDEDRYFKVIVIYPDGRMRSSELFYADF